MNRYSLSHLDRPARLRVLHERNTTARVSTADLIAAIAECDAQKDYLPEGHPSMLSYCIHELALQEEAASKRIHAARAAREFPAIFEALADGRLHLSAVVLLAPHLRPENSDELLCAAAHRSKSEIVKLLRERLARIDVPNLPQVVAAASSEHAPGRVENEVPAGQPVSGQLMTPLARSAPGVENKSRTLMRLMIDEDKLRSARDLLTHRLPSGNASDIVDFALAELIAKRAKRSSGLDRAVGWGGYLPPIPATSPLTSVTRSTNGTEAGARSRVKRAVGARQFRIWNSTTFRKSLAAAPRPRRTFVSVAARTISTRQS